MEYNALQLIKMVLTEHTHTYKMAILVTSLKNSLFIKYFQLWDITTVYKKTLLTCTDYIYTNPGDDLCIEWKHMT